MPQGDSGDRRGVALVITLILLAVITFMAVTFLVVSRGEKNQVSTVKDQTSASDAANAGTEMAIATVLAPAIAYTNPYLSGLLVSTNYQNSGFLQNVAGITNVNYNYSNGLFIAGNDFLQNQVNLQILPRAPVFVNTNGGNSRGPLEFRFYLDLNRNGRYDTNGLLPVMNPKGGFYDTNGNLIANIIPGNTSSNLLVGDPEWIGLLERPGFPHSATNRFVGRYAYIVVPADQTLDLNYIYNQAKQRGVKVDGYWRNEGVGAWEINLAALLADLNTNLWVAAPYGSAYRYYTNQNLSSAGAAFDDALQLLLYRYAGTYKNLGSVGGIFGNPGLNAFQASAVDSYTDGPLMTGLALPTENYVPGSLLRPWPGSDNPNHVFTTQDLFDGAKLNSLNLPFSFTDRLAIAGTNTSTYDRYTFYRMLAQLGTDSAADPPDRMNLNYDNLVQANPVTGARSATNFIPWRPIDFFANAANRLFTNAGFNIFIAGFPPGAVSSKDLGPHGIRLYPTNYYSASVHRLMQLAANIFDAANTNGTATNKFPSVFRPVFYTDQKATPSAVWLCGYQEVTDDSLLSPTLKYHDLSNPIDRKVQTLDMVYGVPAVIGVKKGFPNFNEFAMQTMVSVTRKLEFYRPPGSAGPPDVPFSGETNQMYVVYVTNSFGVEAWNSYSNAYPANANLRMVTSVDMLAIVTNEFGKILLTNWVYRANDYPAVGLWNGFTDQNHAQYSFKIPFPPSAPADTFFFLTNSSYSQSSRSFTNLTSQFENIPFARFQVPRWWLTLRARTRFALVDTSVTPHRIVDYVNLDSTEDPIDITYELMRDGNCGDANSNYQVPNPVTDGDMWCTNRGAGITDPNVPTFGIRNQIAVGAGSTKLDKNPHYTTEFLPGFSMCAAQNFFLKNLTGLGPICTPTGPLYVTNHFFSPINPYRQIYYKISWQANDPLVHYTLGDLRDLVSGSATNIERDAVTKSPLANIGRVNGRYEPWTDSLPDSSTSPTLFDLKVKDPGVTRSDDWNFPINKLPNVGWLGRVHRGTPWQTVYLKAPVQDPVTWKKWSGNPYLVQNVGQLRPDVLAYNSTMDDSILTQPWRDRYLLDVFTTAFNENAARGRMSINQTNLPSWSAILSGVIVVTNTATDSDLKTGASPQYSPWVIDPAGIYSPAQPPALARIVQGIIAKRGDTNLFPQGVFTHLGDILSVPELSVGPTPGYVGTYPNGYWTNVSPFLNLGDPSQANPNSKTPRLTVTTQQRLGLNDEAYERIPQQTLGLLRLDPWPRYVIYSFGQTLKPADHSLVVAGQYFGLCTNYQVTAEAAIRTVVRIEGAPTNSHAVIESFNILPAQ